jgi:peptide/nickel transport system permease protein
MLISIFIGIFAGTFLGVISARKPNSAWDHAVRVVSLVGYSTPEFWLAILLILVFSLYLGFFPLGGMIDPRLSPGSWSYYLSLAWHAILPILALSLFYVAIFARYSRTSILAQSMENYVLTARAKGLDERAAFNKHVLRNSLLPVVTMIGVSFTYILGGAVLIETVFSWPGIGWLMYDAVMARDYPLVQGIFLFATVSVIVVNLLVDVVYGFLDPRVRSQVVIK